MMDFLESVYVLVTSPSPNKEGENVNVLNKIVDYRVEVLDDFILINFS